MKETTLNKESVKVESTTVLDRFNNTIIEGLTEAFNQLIFEPVDELKKVVDRYEKPIDFNVEINNFSEYGPRFTGTVKISIIPKSIKIEDVSILSE